MRTLLMRALMILPVTALPGAAWAEAEPRPACNAPATPRGELAGWTAPRLLKASADAQRLAPVAIGQAVDLTLLPAPQVSYALPPERPAGPASHGGLVGVTVAQAGTYRVALGAGAWIDLVRDGKAVASVAHGHGPACTDVRKIVDFPLGPGTYTVQLSGSAAQQVRVLVARLP